MMTGTKDSRAALGASGKKDVLLFDPENLALVEDPTNPLYDERVALPVSEALVLNIMAYGVIEPIVVRKNAETEQTEVVAGRQRVKACREANKRLMAKGCEPHRIAAIVKRGDSATLMGVMVSENEIREDDTPIGRARKAARFIDLGRTVEEAGVMLGISVPSVKNLLGLLDGPAVVRKAVEAGVVSVSDGYKLSKLEPAEAAERIERIKQEAPRTVGKKRSGNGAKARAIVDGDAVKRPRSKAEILAKLEEVRTGVMLEAERTLIEATLRWALGDAPGTEARVNLLAIVPLPQEPQAHVEAAE